METVQSNATGDDDTGGLLELYWSDMPDVGKTLFQSNAWAATMEWGPPGELPAKFLWAREVGNGTMYAGASPWSEGYDNTGA